jgi:hypothetical protein
LQRFLGKPVLYEFHDHGDVVEWLLECRRSR